MTDTIAVMGIRGFGYHGVLEHETRLGQEFTVDAVLDVDMEPAAAADDLTLTVDYGQVAEVVHGRIAGPAFLLVETLADRICDDLVALPGVHAVAVTIHKPHAPMPVPVGDVQVTRRRQAQARVVLGLGANLGDAAATLQGAVTALAQARGVRVVTCSGVFATAPVGGPPDQPEFLNAVVTVTTTLTPHELLRLCHGIEAAAGRERVVRWGPRTLDIDIIDFAGRVMDEPDLVLPHPRAADRAFVLAPWAQIAADDRLGSERVQDVLARLPHEGVALRPDLRLEI